MVFIYFMFIKKKFLRSNARALMGIGERSVCKSKGKIHPGGNTKQKDKIEICKFANTIFCYCLIQYDTIPYNTIQYGTIQYYMIRYDMT